MMYTRSTAAAGTLATASRSRCLRPNVRLPDPKATPRKTTTATAAKTKVLGLVRASPRLTPASAQAAAHVGAPRKPSSVRKSHGNQKAPSDSTLWA